MPARYRSIKIREDIYNLIKDYKQKHKVPISTAVAHAVSFLQQAERKPKVKENLPLADKVSWYITKTVMSAGAFKENPNEQNFNYLMQNLSDMKKRLGAEISFAQEAAQKMMAKKKENWTVEEKIEYNTAVKSLVLQLLWLLENTIEHSQEQQK
ncbi:MAG: hypothetical protein C0173_06075 [Desulfurella sp.]|uniref:hypothetical protein n=1 Tax=Desulfurella sp. TaxID=1962857 RepID=UPI000CB980C6|nr:hypothetical protein [Desulfurella sp.]PMP89124.1 MAG: hypothetical protein C0173_06075 [Desulfurella sp.]